MKKKEERQVKSIRIICYLHQLTPLLTYLGLLIVLIVGKYTLASKVPETSGALLKENKASLDNMVTTVDSLNSQKKTLVEQKQSLDTNIKTLKAEREADGSLRFYTGNLSAYGRYVEFRANSFNVEIVSVDIQQEQNVVNYVVLGQYNDLVNFFASLETREIYYLENFELLPSFSNSGSYVKFTANFNLDSTITQRYEKVSTKNTTEINTEEISQDVVNVVPKVDTESNAKTSEQVPDDTMNTGKQKKNTVITSEDKKNENTVVTPIQPVITPAN